MMTASSQVFHVAPSGNDECSGRAESDGPFATLHRAARAVAEAASAGHSARIVVHPGVYHLDRPLALNSGHSGSPSSPVIWTAREAGTAILTGGVALNRLRPVTDAAVLNRLPESSRRHVREIELAGVLSPPTMPQKGGPDLELFFRGQRMPRARYPSTGWLQIADVPQSGPIRHHEGLEREKRYDGVPVGRHYGRLRYDGDRPARWSPENTIYLHGYWTWDWSDSIQRVEAIDPEHSELLLAEPHHLYGYTRGQRFACLNVLEELDTPGEWVLDPNRNRLYFYPPESPGEGEVVVSRLGTPLVGTKGCRHLQFQGLVFEGGRSGGLTITGGEDVVVAGCTFRNLGDDALVVEGGHRHRIESCDFHHLASSAIRADGGDRRTLTPSGHVIANNHIHHFSQWLRTGHFGISFGGVGFHLAHNLIHDSPFEAIYLRGNDHLLEYNEIHSVMKESGDAGALHTGRDYTWQGNVIRFNYWHHLIGPGLHGVMGVYLDDFSSGFTVFGNIFFRAGRATLLSGGHDNTVENNLYVDCEPSVHFDARGLGWAHYYFDGTNPCLNDRYREVNADRPPYSERYPRLNGIFDDRPDIPKGNRIIRNISTGSGRWIDLYDFHAFVLADSLVMRDNLIANPGVCRRRETADGARDPYYLDIDRAEGYLLLTADSPEIRREFAQDRVIAQPAGAFDPDTLEFTANDPSWLESSGFQPIPVREIGLRPDDWRSSIPPRFCG